MAENESAAEKWTQSKNQLFSQEALNKMRSPERLDTVLPITTPITWMGLVAVVVSIISVIIWSIFGSFTVKAEGMGIIMDPQGVTNITTVVGGKIDKFYIHSGEKIKKGDKIAHIEQIQENARTRMAQYAPELATSEFDAINKVYEYDARRYQMDEAEFVYSSYNGVVDEILLSEGTTVGAGTPVCSVRLSGGRKDLTGVFYVSVEKGGKRIKPGQTIQLAPNGVDVSLTGMLLGVVRSVSQYPVSMQAVQKRLGNDHLSQFILQSQKSAVMEVTFELVKDRDSESGYLWTSKVGEHKPITAGSFCTGSIIIEKQPPIQKVFYKLSQWLRNI